ncbi:hypothetical protein PoB_006794800 [Plakobranchus ocellatus]|uniref:Uncharacterized protein n=1 Tax=Plakobranchus ocellatus TaxID=259542 RepID=A0AAV4DB05_9GAST|nr:hypothetical protein PoB_006794800 [Plakobranchus ocellatus]
MRTVTFVCTVRGRPLPTVFFRGGDSDAFWCLRRKADKVMITGKDEVTAEKVITVDIELLVKSINMIEAGNASASVCIVHERLGISDKMVSTSSLNSATTILMWIQFDLVAGDLAWKIIYKISLFFRDWAFDSLVLFSRSMRLHRFKQIKKGLNRGAAQKTTVTVSDYNNNNNNNNNNNQQQQQQQNEDIFSPRVSRRYELPTRKLELGCVCNHNPELQLSSPATPLKSS